MTTTIKLGNNMTTIKLNPWQGFTRFETSEILAQSIDITAHLIDDSHIQRDLSNIALDVAEYSPATEGGGGYPLYLVEEGVTDWLTEIDNASYYLKPQTTIAVVIFDMIAPERWTGEPVIRGFRLFKDLSKHECTEETGLPLLAYCLLYGYAVRRVREFISVIANDDMDEFRSMQSQIL